MKTLRQYVVNGGLFAGDGKTPAAAGDQVRLYLDTEAHADFPEYIVGTIQHPVAPILAGTAISYSFEYDEADLLDVVANLITADVINVTVTSAVDVLAANNTGVNTGDETAPRVLALLEDATLPVAVLQPDWIELQDMTGVVIPENSLGRKGPIPYFGNKPMTDGATRFAKDIDASTTNKIFASFPIAAEDMVFGKYFWLELDLACNCGGTPGQYQAVIVIDFQTGGTNDFNTGSIIDLCFRSTTRIKYQGFMSIGSGLGLLPALTDANSGVGLRLSGQNGDVTLGASMVESLWDSESYAFGTGGVGNVAGVANNLVFKLIHGPASTVATCAIRGKVGLYPIPE